MSKVSINRGEIARFLNEIQQEFDKHPIRVPVEADSNIVANDPRQPSTNIYNGPVIHGDANGVQLAWGNHDVRQSSYGNNQIAEGYEAIGQTIVKILEQLGASGLANDEQSDVELAAKEVLAEITQPEPDRNRIRRALFTIKGVLAPVAMGLVRGMAAGANEWARTAIEQLSKHF